MSLNSEITSSIEKIRGFPPLKCFCGLDVSSYTAKTKDNPGRPFYRYKTFRDDHFFKWVEDSVLEEVEDALPRLANIEKEVWDMKRDVQMKMMIEDLKCNVAELKEETKKMKTELKESQMITKAVCVLLCGIGIGSLCVWWG